VRFFDVTINFRISGQRVQPVIKHIPAPDEVDASRKALDTATAKIARSQGATVTVFSIRESDS